jgi:hypothetical protein
VELSACDVGPTARSSQNAAMNGAQPISRRGDCG